MFKKALLLIVLTAIFAPLGMFGQTPVVVDGDNPFFDNFESPDFGWELVNESSTNAWAWGTAVANSGTHSVYISNNGGTSNSYSQYATTWVYFYKLLNFNETGSYCFSYDWKCNGESSDYLRVGLLPESATLTVGSQYPTANWISLDENTTLYNNTNWVTKNANVNVPMGTYKMVFAWRNDYYNTYNPPAAIDNVGITKLVMGNHTTNVIQTSTMDFMKGMGSNVSIANGDIALQYKMASVSDWNATTNLPQNLKDHQVVTWRYYVYCVGGHNGSNPVSTVYRASQQNSGISGWTTLTALPVALRDMAVVATQTHLVVVGGRNNEGVSNKIYQAEIYNDASIGAWEELPFSLPQPCWGARAVEVLGNIYIVGGANTDTENDATDKVYRLTENALGQVTGITEVTGLPEARNGHAVTMYDSKIIVTGGYDATFTQKNTVYTATVNLDGSLGAWQTNTALPNAIYGHTTICTNGILTLIGGKEGTLESNKFYYTDADAATYDWQLSDINLPERYTQGASFAFDNKIFYCGGINLSGSLNNATRYMAVTPGTSAVGHPVFVSWPYDIGTPKQMVDLSYRMSNAASYAYEVLYRTAGEDQVFSNWTSADSDLPVAVNQEKRYLQYMFRVTATGEENLNIEEVVLSLSGYTQLAANLNWVTSLTAENGPYLVTENVNFTSGTHNIGPGVTIYFMPNTGMNVGQASVNFNGTAENPILLTAYESGSGSWNGVYYEDYSDNGVTSVMNYTTIEKAGNGDNHANLRLYYTNQPTISHSSFNESTSDGMYCYYSSPSLSECTFDNNVRRGLSLEYSSSPTCTSCTMNNNFDGLYLYTNNSNYYCAPSCTNCAMNGNSASGIVFASAQFYATFSGVTCANNTYGMYSCTPNRSFIFDSSVVAFDNNTADIALGGGQISSNQTWNYYANGYALLGTVNIYNSNSQPKLTILPGNTIKMASGYYFYIGETSNSYGGQLYAVGTAEQPITFTALNGENGGWYGLRFRDGSDYNSSSSLRYCVVEKANNNLHCTSTNQPSVMWCTFKDATVNNIYLNQSNISIEGCTLKDGFRGLTAESNSNPTVVNVVFDNHSQACVRLYSTDCSVTYSGCTMKNSKAGVCFATPNMDITEVSNVSFENNVCDMAVPGGTINSSHTWAANNYYILGTVNLYNSGGSAFTLTLAPGSVLRFEEGAQLSVDNRGGLIAEGTAEQPITFTPMNGQPGGWNGIYFADYSDINSNQHSSLKHCIVEKGNEYNLYMNYTTQPSLIENCTFQNSAAKGVYLSYSYSTFNNCTFRNSVTRGFDSYSLNGTCNFNDCSFEDNGGYPLYFSSVEYMGTLTNLTMTGNTPDAVVMGGGSLGTSRTWEPYTYHLLGNLNVGSYHLTLMPGTTLKFAEGAYLYVGNNSYYGTLNALGTAEQPIIFTSLNGQPGGWNGIYFGNYSDYYSSQQSSLKHCIVENGNQYDMKCYYTNQPLVESCTFRNSNGYGLWFDYYSSPEIRNSTIKNNTSHGIYLTDYSYPTIGGSPEKANSIYSNGGYAVYLSSNYNNSATINMKYNFWGNIGTQEIDGNLIYDKMDYSSLARVNFNPVSWFPIDNFGHLQGTVTYNNDAAKLLPNCTMNIVNTGDTVMATATTNGSGVFDFSNYAVGSYNVLDTLTGIDVVAGVNATDALLVMRHFVHLDTLVDNYAVIADVNGSNSINGTDAMLIMRRAIDGTFPIGDFYFFNPNGINVSGETCTYDLSFLCYGDVNASYNMQTRANTMELMTEGQLMAESYQELELPVNIKQVAEMGALTLFFNYPEEYLEIEDVVLAATGESLIFAVSNGELRTAWYNLETVALAENDGLILIKVRTKDLSDINEPVAFTLKANSELADGFAQVNENVLISMPEIVTQTMGVSDNLDDLNMNIYPNPANEVCHLSYQLSEAGRVTVSVYNLMGERVMDVGDFRQEEGKHEMLLNTSSLAAGMYCCRITFEGESSWVKTTMLMIEK